MAIVTKMRLAVRAVRLKFRLLTAYDTLWPAAVRGGKLLLQGRVVEFTRKLFNELPDAASAPPDRTERAGPTLFLAGNVLGLGGYDHLVFNVLRGLTEAGVNMCRDRRSWFRKQFVPAELRPTELRRRPDHPRLMVAPPHRLGRHCPDSRTAAYTMWETDTLPPDAVTHLNRCGLVIVPSRWGAKCFRANGVTVPIEVVPLGYDPSVFRQQPLPQPPPRNGEGASISPFPRGVTGGREAPLTPREAGRGVRSCTFGTAGALDEGGLRKNVQRVIDVFRRSFPAQPHVRLRVKITPNSPPVTTHGDSRIEVMNTSLSPLQLAEWYQSLNAFVNASAGEGFGLHLLEAMACGVPLISSTFGGVGAFFDSRVGYEVRFRPTGAFNTVYRGTWSDPDDADIGAKMWEVYRDGEEARRLGEAAAARAMKYRWEDTMRKLVIALIRHEFIRRGE